MGHEKMNPRSRIATWGLRLAIIALLLFVVSVVLNRFDIVSFKIVIPMLGLSALVGGIAVLVSAVGILRTMLSARSGTRYAIAGLVLGLLVAAPLGQTILAGIKLPRIHDITTDLSNPPQFDAVVALRGPDTNSLDRSAPADLAEQQEAAYPDLAPLAIDQHPGKVFEAAEDVARKMGWDIVSVKPEAGVIEATAATRLMNFKDDIVIRVTETETGALVDLRSASRVGESDLGANANRIRSFLHELKKSLS
ncbi:MAG: DUF1499 domain-containing protein [Rhizobiales bacterium]|nr:DUF1499 domain-containing protein [Hyphomicrobiales bacterium]